MGDITKVDETKIPTFNMICGGSPCFAAGTKVLTDRGYANIENIKEGDFVYTHNNRYMKVLNTGGEIDEQLYKINAQGFLDIFCTSYHPFFVKTSKDAIPEKIKAEDIKKGYYLASPINKENIDVQYLTNEKCWLLGRYVADGHIRYNKRNGRKNSYQYGVIYSIGDTKVDDMKNHITEFNYSCYPHSKSVYRFVISSKELVEFILENNFGTSALDKRIPEFILNLPMEKLKSFVDGYMSGDGCYIAEIGLYSATTISRELALTLQAAIHKVYGVGCRIYYAEVSPTTEIENRTVNQHDTYIVRFYKESDRKHLWYSDGNYIWYPVKNVEATSRIENVYNIEVEQDHTYTVENIATYNCQDFSLAGKQEGSMWKCKDCGKVYNPLTVHFTERHKCPNCHSENLDKTRSSLLVEWLRVIRANKPKWGIYENVKNIVGKKFKDKLVC